MSKYMATFYVSRPDKYNSIYTVIEITNNENNKAFFLEPPFLSSAYVSNILHVMNVRICVKPDSSIRFIKDNCKTAVHYADVLDTEKIIKENIG